MIFNRNVSRISTRLGFLTLSGAFALLLGAHTGCNTGPKGPVSVPLEYRTQHSDPITGSLTSTNAKIHVEAIKDKRPNQEEIGKNVEDDVPVPVYSSGKSPAEFVQEVLKTEMGNFGIELTDAPESADRIVGVTLNRFYCEEGNNYKAQISGQAEVRNKAGTVLWKGPIAGEATNFGRSLSPTNYQEAFSDAARRAAGSLLTNPKFGEALTK